MPRKSLSSFDLHRFVEEMSLRDGGFIRAVKSRKNELYLLIFSRVEQWLRIVPGRYVSLSKNKPEDTVEYPFTARIKNELSGKRVSVSMHGSDRIIEIVSGDTRLVTELFSNGNIILVKGDTIEMSMFTRRYGNRVISSGERYLYPEGGIDVFNADFETFTKTILTSDKESLVKAIAIDLSLGGLYAEELCYRANVQKDKKPSGVSGDDTGRMFSEFRIMLSETPKPSILNDTLAVIEIKHTDEEREYFPDINTAIMAFFSDRKTIRKESVADKTAKIEAAISGYERAISYLNSGYDDTLAVIQKVKDSKIPLEKRRESLNEAGWSMEGKFVTLMENKDVKVDITKPLRTVISEYYDKLKKLRETLGKKRMAAPQVNKMPFIAEEAWYSKFRWAVTKNGCMIVIGKDNNQNMSLVEKHADKHDIVIHADVFGSPFGVLKPGKDCGITEEDIAEASSLVASYSSAWKSGAGSLDVYCVKPEQVKKGAPSGEYLKKGAFYIDGKREYVKNAQLGVYISVITSQVGYKLAVTAHKPDGPHVLVRPGNKKREEIIRRVIRSFAENAGILVEKDRVDKLIPPGKASLSK